MKYNYYFPQYCQFNKIKAWQPIVFFKDGIDYKLFYKLNMGYALFPINEIILLLLSIKNSCSQVLCDLDNFSGL
jgi:hypothetical protein